MAESILTEDFQDENRIADVQFDDENLVIRGVSLTYHKSRNGRYGRLYEPKAMEQLRTLSEGAIVYRDAHIKSANDRHADLTEIGEIRNVTGDATRNRGDLHLYEEHPQARLFYRRAKADKTAYALSHEALDCKTVGGKRSVLRVTSIGANNGFVITQNPGTNTTLTEENDEMKVSELKTVAELKEENPEVYEALVESLTPEPPADDMVPVADLQKAQDQIKTLTEEVTTLKEEKAQREAAEQFAQTVSELHDKVLAQANEQKRVLKESLFDLYVAANKDKLADLTEDEINAFVADLPVLVEGDGGGEDVSTKKPKSSSGSATGDKTPIIATRDYLKTVSVRYRR